MTTAAELHVQAAVWIDQGQRFPVLFMEGAAPDRAHGGVPLVDALYTVARARGMRMTTDPELLPLRPLPGWRIRIAEFGTITLEWPHFTPLLEEIPLTLPKGWRDAATDTGVVLVFAGGAVVVVGQESIAAELDGTVGRPRRHRHRPTEIGDLSGRNRRTAAQRFTIARSDAADGLEQQGRTAADGIEEDRGDRRGHRDHGPHGIHQPGSG